MRLIHATVNPEASGTLENVLEQASATFTRLPVQDQNGRELWLIAIDMDQVEPVLEEIRNNRDAKDDFAVVTEAEAILSDAHEERQEEVEESDESPGERISREELVTRAEGLSRGTSNYLLFTVISGIVATVGLLTNSAAVVVGSMVIAPLIDPAMASSVATVVNDNDMFWDGVRTQASGVIVAIVSSALFALILRFSILPEVDLLLLDQVAERVHPGPLALVVAIGAGVAGSLSLTSGASAALVGVMIAVALIPPAATFGLGLAYAKPVVAVSSGVLVFLNLFSINLAGLATLWIKGYRPESWYESKVAWSATLKRSLVLLFAVLVLTGALGFGTYYEHVNANLRKEAVEYLEKRKIPIEELRLEYEFHWWYRSPNSILIRAIEPPDNLAVRLQDHIEQTHGRTLEVRVLQETVDVAPADS